MLEDAGFHDVIAEDRTEQVTSLSEYSTNVDVLSSPTHFHPRFRSPDIFQFLRVLRRELAEVEKNKGAFLADFTQVTKLKHGETLAN
jgi:phosphoethanolamine N-methyltransferase